MKRLLGIGVMVLALYAAVLATGDKAQSVLNHSNVAELIGHSGILALGVGLLIIAGGIDLSIGSVVGLAAVSFALLLERGFGPWTALVLVLAFAPLIGLFHGLLITKLGLQPFLVTLCGLFIFRGLARWATWTAGGSSRVVDIAAFEKEMSSLSFVFAGRFHAVPVVLVVMLVLAVLFAVLLHGSVFGRYLYAIGANEQAARYAGIAVDRYKIAAYMICSFMAGLGGIVYICYSETANPTTAGTWLELYAITAAVLGGCSLRGGDGTILGIVLGVVALRLLYNFCFFAGVPDDLILTVVGGALLLGTITDTLIKRRAAARR